MLKITYNVSYPSVKYGINLPDCLPRLTVITGYNGTGKTRLLEAICGGSICAIIDGENVEQSDIAFYNGRTLEPKTEQQVRNDYSNERDLIWEKLSEIANEKYIQIRKSHKELPDSRNGIEDYFDNLEMDEKVKFCSVLEQHTGDVISTVEERLKNGKRTIVNGKQTIQQPTAEQSELISKLNLFNTSVGQILTTISKKCGCSIFELEKEEYIYEYPSDIQSKPFERSFSRWFSKYIEDENRNEAIKKDHEHQGLTTPPLSNEEFERKYGKKPWRLVDEILSSADLGYEIKKPSYRSDGEYHATLINQLGEEVELTCNPPIFHSQNK